jgi:hypothetical protein
MFAENQRATQDAASIHQISKTFMDYFALASDLEKAKQQEELVVLETSMDQVERQWRELSEQQRHQRQEIQTLTYDFQVRCLSSRPYAQLPEQFAYACSVRPGGNGEP